jgi:hypothetical protein
MAARGRGTGLIILASLLGLLIACYDFVTPSTGIDHSGGVEMVIVSSALMLGGGLLLSLLGSGILAGILVLLIFLDIAGTGTAAWFLESELLMAAMALAALGFILRVTSRRTTP